ncbi:MAG: hypothetical protein ACU84Q_09670 [Gammaproteobacteria bacterium]
MKQKTKKLSSRPRNLVARHPLMAKGGVHRKSEKALRKAAKQELKREQPTERIVAGGISSRLLTSGILLPAR